MKTIAFAAASLLVVATGAARAGTVTYTGADLLSVASFPSAQPTLVGSSLVFSSDEQNFLKLLSLPLGPLPDGKVRIIMDLTRPPCDDPGCVGGEADFDPNFGISDGTVVLGGMVADNFGGQGFQSAYMDYGYYTSRVAASSIFDNAGYPAIGESVIVTFEAEVLPTATHTRLAFLDGSGTFTDGPLTGDRDNLSFVFIRDNDRGERYQINAITVETAGGPESVLVDIKPGSCVNPFNVRSHGVLPVAIYGQPSLNVTDIDPQSLTLNGVPVLRSSFEDVGSGAACAGKTPDGRIDLAVKFDSDRVAATLAGVPDGAVVELPLAGKFRDGRDLLGVDHVTVIRKR